MSDEYGPIYSEGMVVPPSQYGLGGLELPPFNLNGILSSQLDSSTAQRLSYSYDRAGTKTTFNKEAGGEELSILSLSGNSHAEKEQVGIISTKGKVTYLSIDIPNDKPAMIELDFTGQDQELLDNGVLADKAGTHVSFGNTDFGSAPEKESRTIRHNSADWKIIEPKSFTSMDIQEAFSASKEIIEALMLSGSYGSGLEEMVPQIIECLDKFERDSLAILEQV